MNRNNLIKHEKLKEINTLLDNLYSTSIHIDEVFQKLEYDGADIREYLKLQDDANYIQYASDRIKELMKDE